MDSAPRPIEYRVRPAVGNAELDALYAVSWPAHAGFDFEPVLQRALTYVCAYEDGRVIGFVYVAWDGSQHAFLLEPTVHPDYRHRGTGTQLVRRAAEEARGAGCEWLHVDFEPGLAPFYAACGFRSTPAGLINLKGGE